MTFTMELVGVVNRFWYNKPVDPGHPDYAKQLHDWDNYTALVYDSSVETIELLIDDDSDFENDSIHANNVMLFQIYVGYTFIKNGKWTMMIMG